MNAPNPRLDEVTLRVERAQANTIGEHHTEQLSAGVSTPTVAPESTPNPLQEQESALNKRFGRYELMQRIARGGMGVVYKAWDATLGRSVAVKTLRTGALALPEEIERFHVEARAVAQLSHQNIIPIYEIGEAEGLHYFVMELIGGGSLNDHLEQLKAQPKQAAALLEKVARAVQHAHERNILHRDLKPANILLRKTDEPVVTDFGLAKIMGETRELTLTGMAVGTPPYMAPEQVASDAGAIGPATDVWALGVMLYELLTGRRPFHAKQGSDLTEQIKYDDPPRPSSLRIKVDKGLETIALKCLEKDPRRRYPTAGALADDLGRWLRGEAIVARPERIGRKLWRGFRRHPGISTAALFVALVCAFSPFLTSWLDSEPRPPAELLNKLKRGEMLTLIGETGPPTWLRRRTGEINAVLPIDPGVPFQLTTETTTLLELLPDPERDAYRFSAEIRQDHCVPVFPGAGVGLYFAGKMYETPKGPLWNFCELGFDEIGYQANLLRDQFGHCRADFNITYYSEVKRSDPIVQCAAVATKPFSPPQDGQEPRWHSLAIEVTPLCVRTFWNDEQIAENSWEDLLTNHHRFRVERNPALRGKARDLSPRGALGICATNCTASFRNVVFEPMDSH